MDKDNHLNLFWHYGRRSQEEMSEEELEKRDRSINGLENNITRSTIVTFENLKEKNKISFLNVLLQDINKGDVLSPDKTYEYDYELQEVKLKNKVKNAKNAKKYLIGFCPDGSVCSGNKEVTINPQEIIQTVNSQSVDKKANPDAVIIVKDKNKKNKNADDENIVLVVAFENKKVSLYPNQLKRHLVDYLGVETAEGHLIVKNYDEFYGLFNLFVDDSYCKELLEYLDILFLLDPTFEHLEEAHNLYKDEKDEMKRIADRALYRTLKEVYERLNENELFGELRIQKGWGNIIDVTKQFKYINMIGLVWSKDEGKAELNIKLAPNMGSAKSFYKEFDAKDLLFNSNELGFSSWFTFGDVHNYIDKTDIIFRDVEKYFNFFKKMAESVSMKSVGKKDKNDSLGELLTGMQQQIGLIKNDRTTESIIEKVTKTNKGEVRKNYEKFKIWYAPSIQVVKQWSIDDLKKTGQDKLVTEIVDIVEKTKRFFGPIDPKDNKTIS